MNLTEVFKMLQYLETNQNVIQDTQQEDICLQTFAYIYIRMLTNESQCVEQPWINVAETG